MNINASITDFPIFSLQETFFKKFKEAGVDGLELVLGVKSRFEYARISYLSEKYCLPIQSIHQPPWSGVGIYFDASFAKFAKKLGVRYITFHPLAFHAFASSAMQRYLQKLANLQEKYNITVMLENMPCDFAYKRLHNVGKNSMEEHLQKIHDVAQQYGFMLTYDVSHAEIIDPATSNTFLSLLPDIANIHVSSFRKGKHHLPLTMGEFKIEEFLSLLVKKKYQGLFTLEVYSPKLSLVLNRYNFKAIKDSVVVAKKILNKLS